MPRANRTIMDFAVCHITHRCHDRVFLLKNFRERNRYWAKLFQAKKEFKIHILDFSLTHNHVHLLVTAKKSDEISRFMQKAQGEFAEDFNRRHGRTGAFWNDRFHNTLVEDGEHLWNCLVYIEMNMVRAGVVKHPKDWKWCSYNELANLKSRYRLVDQGCLASRLNCESIEQLRGLYTRKIEEALAASASMRAPCWTETVAVGSKNFIGRSNWVMLETGLQADQWCVREENTPYT